MTKKIVELFIRFFVYFTLMSPILYGRSNFECTWYEFIIVYVIGGINAAILYDAVYDFFKKRLR